MMNIQQITDYLTEHVSDPAPKYILIKEIFGKAPTSPEYIDAYNEMRQSKWYRALADEQRDNGSWGGFHGMISSNMRTSIFECTEDALRRARELSLSMDDPIVAKCIGYLERILRGEEGYPDRIEKHGDNGKSFLVFYPYMVAANISLFHPGNPLLIPMRDKLVDNLKAKFAQGRFDEVAWERERQTIKGPYLTIWNMYHIWLLRDAACLDDALQRLYLDSIWHKADGTVYLSDIPPADKRRLEDRDFFIWLSNYECLSGFSLFSMFMKDDIFPHLLCEIDRFMNEDVVMTAPSQHYVRYAESWRDKNKQKTDIILRIARILVRC